VPYYAGEFRDSDQRFPELIDYQVSIGRFAGLAARDVPAALQAFEGAMQTSVQRLDNGLGVNTKPTTAPDLTSVVMLAAASHGEWIRIHPFANGNGRTARLWGNWSLLRYGLPPVLRVKPRPAGIAYAVAAEYSMSSDHRPMFDVILSELNSRI
jgi:fido (protein-threonine AMPylation protein)